MTAREKHPGPDCEEHCIYCAAERARAGKTRAIGPIPTPQSRRTEQRQAEAAHLGLVPGIVAIPTALDTLTEIALFVARIAPGYATLTLFGADAVAMVRALPEAEHGEHVMATEPSRLIRAHLTVADLRVTAQATEQIETCDACGGRAGPDAERTGDAGAVLLCEPCLAQAKREAEDPPAAVTDAMRSALDEDTAPRSDR